MENPKPVRGKLLAALKASLWGGLLFGGIYLAVIFGD
jgi:hypothetical protein